MSDAVKLTVRLPRRLHEHLRRQASRTHRSLNGLIVESLSEWLAHPTGDDDHDAIERVLLGSGLWVPTRADRDRRREADDTVDSHAAMRRRLEGTAPLSETILDERGPS